MTTAVVRLPGCAASVHVATHQSSTLESPPAPAHGPFAIALLAVVISAMSSPDSRLGRSPLQTLRIRSGRTTRRHHCVLAYLISLWGESAWRRVHRCSSTSRPYFIAPFANSRPAASRGATTWRAARPVRIDDLRLGPCDRLGIRGAGPSCRRIRAVLGLRGVHGALARAHPGWGDLSMFVGRPRHRAGLPGHLPSPSTLDEAVRRRIATPVTSMTRSSLTHGHGPRGAQGRFPHHDQLLAWRPMRSNSRSGSKVGRRPCSRWPVRWHRSRIRTR